MGFYSVWLTMLISSIVALKRVDWFFSDTRPAIAILSQGEGDVRYRPQDFALWKDAGSKQFFHEGDIVATKEGSRATIRFRSGQGIALEENTQTQLALGEKERSQDLVITLLKGSIRARPHHARPGHEAIGLTLTAGQVAMDISSGDSLRLTKDIREEAPQIEIFQGKLTVRNLVSGQKMEYNKDSAPVIQTPKAGEEPMIIWPPDNAMLWTPKELSPENPLPLLFSVKDPESGVAPSLIKEVNAASSAAVSFSARKGANSVNFTPPKDGELVVHFGYGQDKRVRFSKKTYSYELKSLTAYGKGPLIVKLPNITQKPLKGFWFDQKPGLTDYRYTIHLKSGSDLPRLAPLLSGGGQFAVRKGPALPTKEGIYVSRGDDVVAALSGAIGPKEARLIRKALTANVVFKGEAMALKQSQMEQPLYVPDGKDLSGIDPELLGLNDEVKDFVYDESETVFKAKVQIIDQEEDVE